MGSCFNKNYADDTALVCSGPTPSIVYQYLMDNLSHILSWIIQSKMQLNTEKSSVMWFRPCFMLNTTLPDVVIDGASLHSVVTQILRSTLELHLIIVWSGQLMLLLFARRCHFTYFGLTLIEPVYHLKSLRC